ncbi:hypothetical protein L3Q82_020216 [Scortum barcoo]|uniref:Uncharacterized protein n=1 Tax=Scortum barcoo TaxID=214431 RepID=A0ACB8V792_9TELE|nr:hypothetical protein L3Q82_020216 [Scortum barcoo]
MEEYITASLGSGIIRPSSSRLLGQDSSSWAKVFTKLDLRNAYHLVRILSFLGYVITANHISMDPAKVDAVTNWPPLTSKKKTQPFSQIVVEVDASNEGIGAVLSQRLPADNRIHPCAFLSRKLSAAERNYDVGNKELLAVKQRFWWPAMKKDVADYVAACSVCARGKASRQARMGLLQPLPVPQRPWSHLTLDFITGLPPSKGNTTVLTVVDRFSKMAHFIPLPKLPSAKETAQVMINHVFRIHGLPTDIVSDRGPQFVSVFWKEFCRLLGATVSQPVLWISPGIQRPDGAHEPGAGDLPAMPCSPEPDNMEPTPDLDRVRAQHPSHSSHRTLAFSCRPWISATSVFGLRTRGYRSIGSCSGQEKSQDLGSCTGHVAERTGSNEAAAADRGQWPSAGSSISTRPESVAFYKRPSITRPFQKTGAQVVTSMKTFGAAVRGREVKTEEIIIKPAESRTLRSNQQKKKKKDRSQPESSDVLETIRGHQTGCSSTSLLFFSVFLFLLLTYRSAAENLTNGRIPAG